MSGSGYLQPLRRRVEYYRGGATGLNRCGRAALPPWGSEAPDFPPRRSRRLGTGAAAFSG